jgi:hypothetical protein
MLKITFEHLVIVAIDFDQLLKLHQKYCVDKVQSSKFHIKELVRFNSGQSILTISEERDRFVSLLANLDVVFLIGR